MARHTPEITNSAGNVFAGFAIFFYRSLLSRQLKYVRASVDLTTPFDLRVRHIKRKQITRRYKRRREPDKCFEADFTYAAGALTRVLATNPPGSLAKNPPPSPPNPPLRGTSWRGPAEKSVHRQWNGNGKTNRLYVGGTPPSGMKRYWDPTLLLELVETVSGVDVPT
jgi:hypothetical protein